jgi:hypothetical protein
MCCMMHGMDHSAHSAPTAAGGPLRESPIDILSRRYALGEISREQFEEMKQVLGMATESAGSSGGGHAHHMSGGGTP